MSASIAQTHDPIALDGGRKTRQGMTKSRIGWTIFGLLLLFGVIAGKLVSLGVAEIDGSASGRARDVITAPNSRGHLRKFRAHKSIF